MSHARDHDHLTPAEPPPKPVPVASRPRPDRVRVEHPSSLPREPVDPRPHPNLTPRLARGA